MNSIEQKPDPGVDTSESVYVVDDRRKRVLSADAAVVAICLLAFLVFLWLLARHYFPEGTNAFATSDSPGSLVSVIDPGARQLDYDSRDGGTIVAELVAFRRDVKVRPVESLAWSSAHRGNTFRFQDSLQTMARSSALISLGKGGKLNVGPNSLIVFKPGTMNMVLPDQATAMVLIDGQVGGELSVQSLPSRQLEFEIPGGLIRLLRDTGSGEELDFVLNVNPDKSSSLALYSGQAEITAGGQTLSLGSRQGLTIGSDGTLETARPLPGTPIIESPRERFEVRFRNIAPAVRFSWTESVNASGYRFQLARDPEFTDIVSEGKTAASTLSRENLSAGLYYWRVAGLDGWHRSRPSAARKLAVVRDVTAPALQMEPATLLEATGQALISGRTDTESRVYVQGDPVQKSADGNFRHLLPVGPGTSLITVEAVDAVGNVAYSTQFVQNPSSGGGE